MRQVMVTKISNNRKSTDTGLEMKSRKSLCNLLTVFLALFSANITSVPGS